MMSHIHIAGAVVLVAADHVQSAYIDEGLVHRFYPPVEKPDFRAVASSTGYTADRFDNPVMQFGLEHELFHHFVAEHILKRPYSRVVMHAARGYQSDGLKLGWPYRGHDEEHLVNYMQMWMNQDEPPEVDHASVPELLGSWKEMQKIWYSARCLLQWTGLRKGYDPGP